MGLFSRKPKVVKEIHDAAWGHMVSVHGIDVDSLTRDFRCVEKNGVQDGQVVKLMRVFRLSEAAGKGVTVAGWETFDQYPELVLYEGYLTPSNVAHLVRKS